MYRMSCRDRARRDMNITKYEASVAVAAPIAASNGSSNSGMSKRFRAIFSIAAISDVRRE